MMGSRPRCPISAYSASLPVAQRITEERMRNPSRPWLQEVIDPIHRVYCPEDRRGTEKGQQAKTGKGDKPEDHDRPERPGNPLRPLVWNENRQMAMRPARIMSVVWEVCSKPGMRRIPSTAERILMAGVITPSPINREMPIIASSETNATWLPDLEEGQQGLLEHDRASFTFLPDMHGKIRVLDGDEDGQRPEDQGEDPHDVLRGRGDEEENGREGIDGTCADIPENKSHGLDNALNGIVFARHFFITSYQKQG